MKTRQAVLALRDAQLREGHARSTRKTYRGWLLRYMEGAAAGRYSGLQGFFDELATRDRLNPKTIKQALNAMVFFYRHVLEQDPGRLHTPKVNKNRNHPTFLHHHEVLDLLGRMRGSARLQAAMLYATGSRINALLTLRLKDIDLHAGTVTFRFDKGGKTRSVPLARTLMPEIERQVEWATSRWEADHAAGIIAPTDDQSLMRKLGRTTFASLPWYWLFPSQVARGAHRWHATDRGLCKAIAKACREARITKRVTAHTFRHSNATALLERGENIRNIQKHLGHTGLETTEIYCHATARGGLVSPLDTPPAVVRFPATPARKRA